MKAVASEKIIDSGGAYKALSTLSQKSETVADNGDSLTFMRQYGQGLRSHGFPSSSSSAHFYRAMHCSANRGRPIEIAYRLSVRPSFCNVGGSGSHKSEVLENN